MASVPFAPGFMTGYEDSLEDARLVGVSCTDCGVVLFGKRDFCENCGSYHLAEEEFGESGEVFSYTVQRAPPTPPFRMGTSDRDEWDPRPVGYVDLPSGVRILSILEGPLEAIDIGTAVTLEIAPGWRNDDGDDVLVYRFVAEEADR